MISSIKRNARIIGFQAFIGAGILCLVFCFSFFISGQNESSTSVYTDSYCSPGILGTSFKDTTIYKTGENDGESAWGETSNSDNTSLTQIQHVQCSKRYVFGSTGTGVDIFKTLISSVPFYGVPILLVVIFCTFLGIIFGVYNGYYSGTWSGKVSILCTNVTSSYPQLLIAVLLVCLLGNPALWIIALVFGVTESVRLSQAIMNKISALQKEDFIEAAREIGLSDRRIILKHILWYNCKEIIIYHALFAISSFILLEAYMGFLGVGNFNVWGKLLSDVKNEYHNHPLLLLLPSAFIASIVFAFNMIGEGVIRFLNIDEEFNR